MLLSEIEDEWTNREETSKQLLRVHLARITELIRFYNYLINKYKWSHMGGNLKINDYIRDPADSLSSAEQWTQRLKKAHPEIIDSDLHKAYQTWSRMIAIKKRIGHNSIKRLGYL